MISNYDYFEQRNFPMEFEGVSTQEMFLILPVFVF